jgi:hypothetical protein
MIDTNGKPIHDCLEPHIQRFDGVYYAYGFTVRTPPYQFATTCYASADLVTWSKRAHFPVNITEDGSNGQLAVALWYVIHNPKTNEYVGYGGEYGVVIHVYTSKSPIGTVLVFRLDFALEDAIGITAGTGIACCFSTGLSPWFPRLLA